MTKIRIGVIGYGFIGKIHIENLLKFSNAKLISIFSTINENDIPKGISFYMDYKKMLSKENIDVVIICTPTHTHKDITCYCAEQGIRNIFLEKPMANTLENCNIILDAIKVNNSRLFIGHVLRFWSTYGSIENYLSTNNSKLGEIQSIISKRLGTFPWSKWFADQEKSGGVILDLSIHDIDYALWIFGKPISISCKAKQISKYQMQVFGESNVLIKFKRNKIAECEASWAKPKNFQFYTYTKIRGSENFIEFDGNGIFNNNFWKIHYVFNSDDGYINEMEYFLDCVSKNEVFRVSGEEGMAAVKTCLAAIESAKRNGSEIYIEELE